MMSCAQLVKLAMLAEALELAAPFKCNAHRYTVKFGCLVRVKHCFEGIENNA